MSEHQVNMQKTYLLCEHEEVGSFDFMDTSLYKGMVVHVHSGSSDVTYAVEDWSLRFSSWANEKSGLIVKVSEVSRR